MKNHSPLLTVLFAVLLTVISVGMAQAQEDNYGKTLTTDYTFVVIETLVTRDGVQTSDRNPQEHRFYVSSIVEIPRSAGGDRQYPKIADRYFTQTVVEPLKTRGILHQYYDNNLKINGGTVLPPESRAAAEEMRNQLLANLKEQGANVFTFTWQFDGDSDRKFDGLKTSVLTLFYREPGKPIYGDDEMTDAPQDAQTTAKPPVKKKSAKKLVEQINKNK